MPAMPSKVHARFRAVALCMIQLETFSISKQTTSPKREKNSVKSNADSTQRKQTS